MLTKTVRNSFSGSVLDGIFVSTFANADGGSLPNGTINLTQGVTVDRVHVLAPGARWLAGHPSPSEPV